MPLKTFVKASSITNLSDARYFSAYPVDWLSYQCNPISKKYADNNTIHAFLGWVSGPKCCLEVSGLSNDKINALLSNISADGLEMDSAQQFDFSEKELTIFRRLYITPASNFESLEQEMASLQESTDYFVLDFTLNQVSLTDDFIKTLALNQLCDKFSILLDATIEPQKVSSFLELGIHGLNIQSGEEQQVGLRSFDDIQDLMEELDEWE